MSNGGRLTNHHDNGRHHRTDDTDGYLDSIRMTSLHPHQPDVIIAEPLDRKRCSSAVDFIYSDIVDDDGDWRRNHVAEQGFDNHGYNNADGSSGLPRPNGRVSFAHSLLVGAGQRSPTRLQYVAPPPPSRNGPSPVARAGGGGEGTSSGTASPAHAAAAVSGGGRRSTPTVQDVSAAGMDTDSGRLRLQQHSRAGTPAVGLTIDEVPIYSIITISSIVIHFL